MAINKILNKLNKFFCNSEYRFRVLSKTGVYSRLKDEEYLKKEFYSKFKYPLNLETPKSFNEKLQWLKLYDRNPSYIQMVDKYCVRQYIAKQIGEKYLIPLLGVWDNPNDIDFEKLPNQFVLKCNHTSGTGLCICTDKSLINFKKVKTELNKALKMDYYKLHREWPYKDVPRKIIAEEYMQDYHSIEGGLNDYKFMCFSGKVKCTFVCSERFSQQGLKVTFFDKDWNLLPFERHYPKSVNKISKPLNYNLMIALAEKLSQGIPFVRVDFYENNGNVYFGELTFFPGAGLEEFTPEIADYELGKWIVLPENHL